MSRRLKALTAELGHLDLYFIYDECGTWEPEWRPLQKTPWARLMTHVSKGVTEHLLHGWSKPFVEALGPSPEGCLRLMPDADKVCHRRRACSLYLPKMCFPTAKHMPWCFEPGSLQTPDERRLATEILTMWREGVYVVVVYEPEEAP